MVAIVTGNELGLSGSSGSALGTNVPVGTGSDGVHGVFVNAKTGNLILQHQDELLVGQGPDIGVVRTYNSQAVFDFDNGDGWQISLYRKLTGLSPTANTAGSQIQRIGADGAQLTYTYDATLGLYVNTDGGGAYNTLSYDGATDQWIWTEGDTGITESYAANGAGDWRVSARSDTDGNTLTYTYDIAGLISRITDANGETTVLIYNASKQLEQVDVLTAEGTLTRVRYAYDSSGRLETVTTDLSPEDGDITDGNVFTTTYTYDGASTRIASISNTDGTQVSFTYNAGRIATVTDGRGQVTTFTYTTDQTTITDPIGQVTTLNYDIAGQLTHLQGPAGQDVQYTYNANGDLLDVTDSRGNTTVYQYDTQGNRTREQDAAGNVVEREYNSANQLIRQTRYLSPDPDGAGPEQATAPLTTHYVYDAEQHLRFIISPEGRVTEYQYNAAGEQISVREFARANFDPQNLYVDGWSWLQNFDDGMGDIQPSPLASAEGFIRHENGKIVVTRKAYPNTVYPNAVGKTYGIGVAMSAEVHTGVAGTEHHLVIGLENASVSGVIRRHAAYFNGDSIYASYYDPLTSTWIAAPLGALEYDATYVVEVETDPQGSTLFVYKQGTSRAEGFTHRQDADDWGIARTLIHTLGGPGLATASTTIDNLKTTIPKQWAQDFESDAYGLSKLPGSMQINNGVLEITSNQQSATVWESVSGIHSSPGSVWRAEIETPPQGGFAALQLGMHEGNWAASNYRRHNLRFDGTSVVASSYLGAVATNTAIGSVKNGTRYVIEASTDSSGQRSVLRLYEKGTNPLDGLVHELQMGGWVAPRLHMATYSGPGAAGSIEGNSVVFKLDNVSLQSNPEHAQLEQWVLAHTADVTGRIDRSFDVRGQLQSETHYVRLDANGNGIADGTESTTVYVRDAHGRLLQRVDPRGVATTGNANDYLTSYAYDGLGRVISLTQYDALGSAMGSGATRYTQTTFNDAAHQVEVTLANGLTQVSTYDARGQLSSVVERDGATALATTQYQYDALGRQVITIDPNGNKSYTVYDETGRIAHQINAERQHTSYEYNASGQLVRTRRHAYAVSTSVLGLFAVDANGLVATVLPSDISNDKVADLQVRNIYDALGRLRFELSPKGSGKFNVTELRYDGAGQLIERINYANALSYDSALDAFAVEITPEDIWLGSGSVPSGQPGVRLDAANDRVTRYFYDADGLLVGTLDGEGYLSEQRYDASGRLIQSIAYATQTSEALRAGGDLDALRSSANTDPDANQISHVWYNAMGQRIAQVDAEGYLTTFEYDPAGNLSAQTRHARRVQGTIDAAAPPQLLASGTAAGAYVLTSTDDQRSTWTYNAFNQIDSETRPGLGANTVKYFYDPQGRLTGTVQNEGASDERAAYRRYDLQGRLIGELNGVGSAALDALGATPTQAQIDAVWASYGTTHEYDVAGRLTRSTDANSVQTLFFYDNANRLTYTVRRVRNPQNTTEWIGEVSRRVYNALGQVDKEIGYATRLTFAQFSTLSGGDEVQVSGVVSADTTRDTQTTLAYNAAGLVSLSNTKLNGSDTHKIYSYYNAFGELREQRDFLKSAASARQAFSYDRRGLQVGQSWSDALSTTVGISSSVEYDAFGRAVSRTDANGNTSTASYDKLGRQIETVVASGVLDIHRSSTYDAFGRVLTQTDGLNNATSFAYAHEMDGGTEVFVVSTTTAEGVLTETRTNAYGQVISITDGNGDTTRFTYDKNGNVLTEERIAAGQSSGQIVSTQVYDTAGLRLNKSIDANGNTVQYHYDAANRLLSRVVDPEGLALSTTYAYDALGRQIEMTDPSGTLTRTTYDQGGRVIDVAIDPAGLNLRTHYDYDLTGNQLSVTEGYGTSEARTTAYEYDALGRRTSQTVDPGGLTLVTTYAYDKNNNLVTRIEGTGGEERITRYAYDAADRLTYTVDALGGVLHQIYDDAGQLLRSTAYANAINLGGLATQASAASIAALLNPDATRDRSTRHVYDKDGRERFTIDAFGAITEMRYDEGGQVTERIAYATLQSAPLADGQAPTPIIDAQDRHSEFDYDALGRLTDRRDAVGTSDQTSEHWDYDAAGQMLRHTDTRGNHEWFAYDAAGRQIRHIDQGGYVTDTAWNADGSQQARTRYQNAVALSATDLNWAENAPSAASQSDDRTISFTYDNAGRLETSTDALGVVTRTQYDSLSNAQYVTVAEGTSAASTTYRQYDAVGRITAETVALGSGAEATTRYAYDIHGNQTHIIEARGNALAESNDLWAQEQRVALGYATDVAALNNTQKEALRAFYTTVQEFDTAGRKTAAIDATGARLETAYNAFGDIISVTDALGHTGYFYTDALGRVIAQVDPTGALTETTYDALGNVTSTRQYATAVSGASETNRPAGVINGLDRRQETDYDVLGRKTEVRSWWGPGATEYYTESMHYDAQGNLESSTARNGATTTYTYDVLGRKQTETLPITSKNAQGNATPVVNRFEYDHAGNLTQQIEADGLPEQRITTYTYTARGQQHQKIGEALTVFDAQSGLSSPVTPTETREYDARGNLVREQDARGAQKLYYYDAADRLVGQIDPEGAYTANTYDDAGQLIAQTHYATPVAVVGGGQPSAASSIQVLATVPASGAYVLANAEVDRTTYFAYDGAGRQTRTKIENILTGETDQSGNWQRALLNLITRTQYDAAGNIVKQTDARNNVTRFYYDAAGNRIAQLDAEQYLSRFTYDTAGTLKTQVQFANRVSLSVTDATTLAALEANAGTHADDRITEYTLDALGRITQSRQVGIATGSVNTTNGQLNETTQDALSTFAYDGLDNVVRHTDAEGQISEASFDALGRQTQQKAPSFIDFEGVLVTPSTDTEYDGLGNVVRSIERGRDNASEADDRISTYAYNAQGWLIEQVDAAGAQTTFRHDALGNVTEQTLHNRVNADNVSTNDVTRYLYDLNGQQTSTEDVATGAIEQARYNAFGEIVANRSTARSNGSIIEGPWQQSAEYDRAGRMWKSITEGATTLFAYDANGNATLSVKSVIHDLSELQVIDEVTALNPGELFMEVSRYDRRNQLIDVFEPEMIVDQEGDSVSQTILQTQGAPFSGGQIASSSATTSSASASPISASITGAPVAINLTWSPLTVWNDGNILIRSLTVDFRNSPSVLEGSGNVFAVIETDVTDQTYNASGTILVSTDRITNSGKAQPSPSSVTTFSFPDNFGSEYVLNLYGSGMAGSATGVIKIVQESSVGHVEIARASFSFGNYPRPWGAGTEYRTTSVTSEISSLLRFGALPLDTAKVAIKYRSSSSASGWNVTELNPSHEAPTYTGTTALDVDGDIKDKTYPIKPGTFSLDWSGWTRGNYEFEYIALDAAGNVLEVRDGQMTLSDSAPSITINPEGVPFGGPGRVFMDSSGQLVFTEFGLGASSLRIGYRSAGTSGAYSYTGVSSDIHGVESWRYFAPEWAGMAAGEAYDYVIEALNGNGSIIQKSKGSFTVGNGNSVTELHSDTSTLQFSSQPAGSKTLALSYTPAAGGATQTVTLNADVLGRFDWETEGLVPVGSTTYDYSYDVRDAFGVLINRASGQVTLGDTVDVLSHVNAAPPNGLNINPSNDNALELLLEFGPYGSDTYAQGSVVLVRTNGNEPFVFDAAHGLPEGMLKGDYRYTLRDANGNRLKNYFGEDLSVVVGSFDLDAATDDAIIHWQVQNGISDTRRMHRAHAYNAFGQVVSETDGRGNETQYKYNGLGLTIEQRNPLTDITLANGYQTQTTPTTQYIYDLAGRIVGVRDANGNLNTQVWRPGGSDLSAVADEFHADTGRVRNEYDIFGDLRSRKDEVDGITRSFYDAMGRLIRVEHPERTNGIQAVDTYAYDAAGQRISHTNSLGTEKTFYDSLGRVIQTRTALGRATQYTYQWSSDLVADPDAGGWIKTTTLPDGHSMVEKTDVFDRLLWKQDYGGHTFDYKYDEAGYLVEQTGSTTGQHIKYSYYANGFLRSIEDMAMHTYTGYEYDRNGNRTRELYRERANGAADGAWQVLQNASITYDAMNRMTRFHDATADIRYEYDANGNRIHMISYYHDGVGGHQAVQEYWYKYDTMNRFVVTKGELVGGRGLSALDTNGQVTKGTEGVALAYDLAGRRTEADDANSGNKETYTYTADGYLEKTLINGIERSRRTYDAAGRVTTYQEFGGTTYTRTNIYDADSRLVQHSATGEGTTYYRYYDANGAIAQAATASGSNNPTNALGVGELALTTNKNGTTTIHTYTDYEWWDEAKQKHVTADPYSPTAPNWKNGYSHFTYDVNGHLDRVDDPAAGQTGKGRTIHYRTNAQGLILRRDERAGGTADAEGIVIDGAANKSHRYYYKDGARIGDVNNDGQSSGVSYAEQIAQRSSELYRDAQYARYVNKLRGARKARTIRKLTKIVQQYEPTSNADKYRNWRPINSADFDQSYLPVNEAYPASTPSTYTIRNGDSLQSIAAVVWGDASMWYLIADLNGLTGADVLVEGQTLTIPNKVTNIHNNATTFMPYNAGEAIGDVSPTLPEPPPPPAPKQDSGGGCGVAQILVAIVAVVATVLTAGALAPVVVGQSIWAAGAAALTSNIGIAAVAGAVGSAAGQLTGMALGVQDSFSWTAVATGAIAGAATAYIGGPSGFNFDKGLSSAVGYAVTSNVVNQGVNILAGQQKSFSWKSVAASAVTAGIAHEVGNAMFGKRGGDFGLRQGNWAKANPAAAVFAESAVTAGISAATRVAVFGGRVSWEAVAADALSSSVYGLARVQGARAMSGVGWTQAPAPVEERTWISSDEIRTSAIEAQLLGAFSEPPTPLQGIATVADASDSLGGSPIRVVAGDRLDKVASGGYLGSLDASGFGLPHFAGANSVVFGSGGYGLGEHFRLDAMGVESVATLDQESCIDPEACLVLASESAEGRAAKLGFGDFVLGWGERSLAGVVNTGVYAFSGITGLLALPHGAGYAANIQQKVYSRLSYDLHSDGARALEYDMRGFYEDVDEMAGRLQASSERTIGLEATELAKWGIKSGAVILGGRHLLRSVGAGVLPERSAASYRLVDAPATDVFGRPVVADRGVTTLIFGNRDAVYTIDNATGLTIRAEGVVTGPHVGRGKGRLPEPVGGRVPGEHRGHLIPEGGVDTPAYVNISPNLISEAPASNLGLKKIMDLKASRIAAENFGSTTRFVAEPIRRIGETRPFAVSHFITVDGRVVEAVTVLNK